MLQYCSIFAANVHAEVVVFTQTLCSSAKEETL
jgi:hypothetical protein